MSRYWPLSGVRVRTGRLELRWPTAEDLDALADLAAEGVVEPGFMPFRVPWPDAADVPGNAVRHHWSVWGAWSPDHWRLDLVTVVDGVVVGTQGMGAERFGVRREVSTGSWLGRRYQGRGIGTEMRVAILHLAFAGLGATYAVSDAHEDNAASLRVSAKLGYTPDGSDRETLRDTAQVHRRFRLDRAAWATMSRSSISIDGLADCLPLFGLRGT